MNEKTTVLSMYRVIKLTKIKDKDKILKATREKKINKSNKGKVTNNIQENSHKVTS